MNAGFKLHNTLPTTAYLSHQLSLFFALSATPIVRPIPPSNIKTLLTAIKHLFSQLFINLVMRTTHPLLQVSSTRRTRLVPFVHPRPEIIRTMPTRVKLAQRRHKTRRIPLFLHRRFLWKIRRQRMEERPRRSTQDFYVRRTMRRLLYRLLGSWLLEGRLRTSLSREGEQVAEGGTCFTGFSVFVEDYFGILFVAWRRRFSVSVFNRVGL